MKEINWDEAPSFSVWIETAGSYDGGYGSGWCRDIGDSYEDEEGLCWYKEDEGRLYTAYPRPEEMEAEARSAYCDRIYGVLCKAERSGNRSDMAEALYDAGLRFTEKD